MRRSRESRRRGQGSSRKTFPRQACKELITCMEGKATMFKNNLHKCKCTWLHFLFSSTFKHFFKLIQIKSTYFLDKPRICVQFSITINLNLYLILLRIPKKLSHGLLVEVDKIHSVYFKEKISIWSIIESRCSTNL